MSLLFDCRVRDLDADWLALLARHGFAVVRSPVAWVAYDGAGTITIAPDDLLDADDSIAQIAFHELCHFWVEGEASRAQPDWGLDNTDEKHVSREQAALRLQAHLLDRHGLRLALVATTDFRPYYESLPADPLAGQVDDPAIVAARTGLEHALRWGGFDDVCALLERTRALLEFS